MPTTTASISPDFPDQLALIAAALDGDEKATAMIRCDEANRRITAMVIQRGASPTEADEIVADIWSEAFKGWKGKKPLLARFDGKGNIVSFLGRCALNRLIDQKRRARFRGDLPGSDEKSGESNGPVDTFDTLEGDVGHYGEVDDNLVDLLRDSLIHAMAHCPPQTLLIMKLVSLHGVQQKTISDMWGWSHSKVSRALTAATDDLRDGALAEIKRVDPWLEIQWSDIVKLCAQSSQFLR